MLLIKAREATKLNPYYLLPNPKRSQRLLVHYLGLTPKGSALFKWYDENVKNWILVKANPEESIEVVPPTTLN